MALGARDDAIVYGCSLYVISRGPLWQGRAALLKGVIMTAFGIGVLVQVAVKIARELTPTVEVMGAVGLLAFAAAVAGPRDRPAGRGDVRSLGVPGHPRHIARGGPGPLARRLYCPA
jgi:hypothetical protein